ncbi:MAG TPA: acyl-CoA dehydrogenase family protein [Dehalococcoidia bacterium]|nr:acyl-CoA dehydrogenase family protein [Dehalococcoidia bacterium]
MLEVFLTEERKKFRQEVQDFVKSIPRQLILDMDADKIKFPYEFVREAGKRNLLGTRFPKKYGGRDLKWVDELIEVGEVNKLGVPFACLVSVTSIVGEGLNVFGTEAQKKKYLRPLIAGTHWAGEALTEPRGGSDFFGATTVAHKKGNHYYLTGQKRFVVGSEGADFFLVFAVTNPGAGRDSLSAFIVEREMGVEVKHVYGLMGGRGTGTGRLVFRDVPVPEENLLGKENEGAKVFYKLMVPERIFSGGVGGARAILEMAARYANKRKAFGLTIKNFEGVNFRIADCVTKLDAVSALAYAVAKTIDDGVGTAGYQRRLVSEVKKLATQTNWEVVNDAMQILGGIGYTNVFPVERALREARLLMIWTGSSEVMNLIIQHEYYKEILAKGIEGRDIEADVSLTPAELAEERIYEAEPITAAP